jgi:hypothetical protein
MTQSLGDHDVEGGMIIGKKLLFFGLHDARRSDRPEKCQAAEETDQKAARFGQVASGVVVPSRVVIAITAPVSAANYCDAREFE